MGRSANTGEKGSLMRGEKSLLDRGSGVLGVRVDSPQGVVGIYLSMSRESSVLHVRIDCSEGVWGAGEGGQASDAVNT